MANNIQKNSNVARVKSSGGSDFFYKWLSFLYPLHSLTNMEMKVLSVFLEKRQELLSVVKDEKIINNILKSSDVRKELREKLGLKAVHFNLLLSGLRKAGVFNEFGMSGKFIPNIESDSGEYRLIMLFDISQNE